MAPPSLSSLMDMIIVMFIIIMIMMLTMIIMIAIIMIFIIIKMEGGSVAYPPTPVPQRPGLREA